MSSRRSRAAASSSSSSSRFTEDEINSLVLKLQRLLPSSSSRNRRVHASKILEEISNYIKKLNKDADDLSERLSQLMSVHDINGIDAETIRSLLHQ